MKLVDPNAKATAEPDAYSWEFILDSVYEDKVMDKSSYLMTVKCLPSGARQGRHPFTTKEKQLLLEYLSAPGLDLGSNAIYKEFARKHPSHAWQSWKDHAKKFIIPELLLRQKGRGAGQRTQKIVAERETPPARSGGPLPGHPKIKVESVSAAIPTKPNRTDSFTRDDKESLDARMFWQFVSNK
ncbi:hypothetical protein HK104_006801 [Borealophlyctis nickersoniae]|nr:hypothetical protein HK104_006801 [Borealophlyctis nickersoniae]